MFFPRFNKIWIFLTDFHTFHLIPSSGSIADSADREIDRQMDRKMDRKVEGQTDGNDEGNSPPFFFLRLCERAEK